MPRSSSRPGVSAALVIGAAAVAVVQLAVIPLLLLPRDRAWGLVLVDTVPLTTPLWSIIH